MKRLLIALVFFPIAAWAQDGSVAPPTSVPAAIPNAAQKFGSPCAYPDSALRDHTTGQTGLSFFITPDGGIAGIVITGPSGHTDLDAAAVQCISHWHTDPDANKQRRLTGGTIAWTIPVAAENSATPSLPMGRFRVSGGTCSNYPPAAIKAKEEGTAIVLVHVTEEGAVGSVEIVRSSGNADLDEASLACVTNGWRFHPAMQNGKPVPSKKEYAIRWVLDPNAPPS